MIDRPSQIARAVLPVARVVDRLLDRAQRRHSGRRAFHVLEPQLDAVVVRRMDHHVAVRRPETAEPGVAHARAAQAVGEDDHRKRTRRIGRQMHPHRQAAEIAVGDQRQRPGRGVRRASGPESVNA